jgi:hypothetical protein
LPFSTMVRNREEIGDRGRASGARPDLGWLLLLVTRYSFRAFCICHAGRLTTVRCRLAYPCATRAYVRGTTIATELGCGAVATSGGTIVTGGGADR